MIHVSFDPEQQTLYWYFTEIEAGSTASEGECDGGLLLDSRGDVIGLELEFDESIGEHELALALSHAGVSFDRAAATLTVTLFDEEPASVQPLHDIVIVDLDAADRIQGCDVAAAKSFKLAKRLGRLEPFMVALEDQDEDEGTSEQQAGSAINEQVDANLRASAGAGLGLAEADNEHDQVAYAPQLDVPEDTHANHVGRGQAAESVAVEGFRSGFVALVGPPNAGKSTLMNALLGQKVAIVSPRPQTTRMAIRGILNRADAQIVFVDTPGIHRARTRLGSFMVDQARRSIPDADVICMIVDMTRAPDRMDEQVAGFVRRAHAPKLLVLNKVDLKNPRGAAFLEGYRALADWDMELVISALRKLGLETLMDEIVARLPQEQPMYPTDQVTDQSEREMVAELLREQVLKYTQQEVPHGVAIEIEEWQQRERNIYIRLSIYVEKESQKGILIGAGGEMLKRIGSQARKPIEEALGQPVFLDLWVKTRPNWRDDPNALHWLGYKNRS